MSPVRRPLLRRLLLSATLALALALAVAGWTAWQVLQGGRELQRAADLLRDAEALLQDEERGLASVDAAARSAALARAHFSDPVVQAVATLPLVGRPVDLAAALARSADTALSGAVRPLLVAAGADPVSRLLPGQGRVDLEVAETLNEPARSAARALQLAEAEVRARPTDTGIGPLDEARRQLTDRLGTLADAVEDLSLAVGLAPDLLGGNGDRTYLVIPQNTAEARGTGGLVGGYLLLRAQQGQLAVVASGPNADLRPAQAPVVDLGAAFAAHYGRNGALQQWNNANLTPHFPDAARIWSGLWAAQSGQEVDGVVALDPTALSYLLEATGPVRTSDGTVVTSADVVQQTLVDAYVRFDRDSRARDAFLQDVSRSTASALLGSTAPRPLLSGLARAAQERRLLLWLRDPALQGVLAERDLAGGLPASPAVGAVVSNAAASKLDVYLEREVVWTPPCEGATGSLVVRLRNGAPATGLPEYVSLDLYRDGFPVGTNQSLVTLYVPSDLEPGELTVDGVPQPDNRGREQGLRYVETSVRLLPGQTAELRLTVTGRLDGEATVIQQALARPQTVSERRCD